MFSRLFVFLIIFLSLQLQAAEDRKDNPLYKALPSIQSSVEELFNYTPEEKGFVVEEFRKSLAKNWVPTEENFFQDPAVILAEKRFVRFCQNKEKEKPTIPKLIHFIWMGSPPPDSVYISMDSWKKHHPDWEIKLWTDTEIELFNWTSDRSKLVFQSGKNWAEKSDILRFEILYQYGGIYSDTDVVCVNSFENLICKEISFFAGFESNKIKRFGRPLIGSAVIGAKKNSPVIMRCIDFTKSSEEEPTVHQHLRSGPGPITKASYEALELKAEDVLLLPCSYLYPLPWEMRLADVREIIGTIQKETLALHLWEGSWFDFYHPPKQVLP
ncbi:MAG TPA: glycosyltransferase [Chlamydiales bacterium]|nr:MAG: hypothetical protein A3F67_03975 [Verrucomicrobia bacterium RIFCSPHIGHO2_12_FULL_41_10]HLB52343.1 glycosyltransferase [Chlamydiales bacterium]